MANSDFIYESGDPVVVGAHGEHDYVYASGEPVSDTGQSSVVFESGTGLGGKYEIVRPDGSTHIYAHDSRDLTGSSWYDYTNSRCEGVPANEGWLIDQVTTLFIYEESDGTPHLAVIHDWYTQDSCSVDTQCDMNYSSPSESSGLPSGTTLEFGDDSGDDSYTAPSNSSAEWTLEGGEADWGTNCRTDGVIYQMPTGTWETDISQITGTDRQPNTMDDFASVDKNGNVEYYGQDATITVRKLA